MPSSIRFIITITILSIILAGCSGGSKNPIMPTGGSDGIKGNLPYTGEETASSGRDIDNPQITELTGINDVFEATGILGAYEFNLSPDGINAELVPLRTSALGESFLVSGASWFTVKPCIDCFRIESIELTADNLVKVVFNVSHPFEKGDRQLPPTGKNRLDLDLFDLAMVIVPHSATIKTFTLTGVQVYPTVVKDPDGYTNELSALTLNPNVYPYYLVVDDSETGEATYNKFEMGVKDKQIAAHFSAGGNFRLYLTMGYGVSAVLATRLSPVYYNPEFNKKAPWKVEVVPPQGSNPPVLGNTWDDGDATTARDVTVKVYDWQHTAAVTPDYPDPENPTGIYKASRVLSISLEIQNMTSALNLEISPLSGDGSPSSPLVYKIPVKNEKKLAPGKYFGLVKIKDSRTPARNADPGTTDALVHSPDGGTLYWNTIPDYTTYQIFEATVVAGNSIRITSPNGGETWGIGSAQSIQWTSSGTVGNVSVYLSVDGGSSYSIPLANNIPDTGTLALNPVGNWPTAQARVKVYSTAQPLINDTSDSNFIIQTITQPVEIISPNGGEVWHKGTQHNITWSADASIHFVKIQLSKDSGATYPINITGSTANDGIHQWNIPDEAISDFCRIKISDIVDLLVFDESDADFAVDCPMPNPPNNIRASDDTYPDKVTLAWDPVTGATGYNVYRDSVLQQGNYSSTSWNDTAVVSGVIYHYQVESIDFCGTGSKGPADPGEPGSACVLPTAPLSCTATDGTYADHVEITWDTVAAATSYSVYRDFGVTPVASGIPAPPWSDFSVIECDNHDYEVVAVASCGESDRSPSDSGYSEIFPLQPQNVSATDGDFSNKIVVTWDAIAGVTGYNIYRDSVLQEPNYTGTSWEDTSITQGFVYNYQIEALNNCGPGPISILESGYACILPPSPLGVTATDDVFPDRVKVDWGGVPGATGYNIYRDGAIRQANYVGITWDDSTVTPGVIYNYQIQAINGCGNSDKSPADPGEPGSACINPDTPTGLSASDGTVNDRVVLTWNAAANATTYNIYRDASLLQANVGNVVTWDDMSVTPGVMYSYQVEAENSCGVSASFSISDDGYAFACTPDSNDTCGNAEEIQPTDSVSGCVDQVDQDWYSLYTTPNGFTNASTIDLAIPTGTVDLYVYGIEPGGSCPGSLIYSVTNVGAGTYNLPSTTQSRIYVRLIGNSGQVMYTMDSTFIPALTHMPIQICVATDDGTPTGTWPLNGGTPLTLATLNNMIDYNNNIWNQYGYDLDWDGSTVTIMSAQYYNLDNNAEENSMHTNYHINNKLSLYFVNQLVPPGNTAYCHVYNPQSIHNVNNVRTVYSPNVWSWQAVVAHEHGHGFAYFFDEYLYDMYGCACGDNVCLGYTPYLYWETTGCYAGDLMFYDMGWAWSSYELTTGQYRAVHVFNFNNPTNFPWF